MDQRARLTWLLLLLSAALLAEPVNAKWWKPQGNPETGWNKVLDWVLQPFKPKADSEKPPAHPEKPPADPSPIPPGDDIIAIDPAKPAPPAGEDVPSSSKAIPEEQGSADTPLVLTGAESYPPKEENGADLKARPKPPPRPRQPGLFPFPKRHPRPSRRFGKPGKRFSKSRSRPGKPAARSRSFSAARSRSFSVAGSRSFSAAGSSSSRRNRSRRF